MRIFIIKATQQKTTLESSRLFQNIFKNSSFSSSSSTPSPFHSLFISLLLILSNHEIFTSEKNVFYRVYIISTVIPIFYYQISLLPRPSLFSRIHNYTVMMPIVVIITFSYTYKLKKELSTVFIDTSVLFRLTFFPFCLFAFAE